jgi:hypothetical protein
MVNTTFDPYLEGPQGGIWFWALFGLGLVLIRLAPRVGRSDDVNPRTRGSVLRQRLTGRGRVS